MLSRQKQRKRRHERVRAKIKGTAKVPRFCVFRSNKYIYGQIIDDTGGVTLFSIKQPKTMRYAGNLGKEIAKRSREKNIEKVVFDRGGYKYHGSVKAVAEGAREGGLKF